VKLKILIELIEGNLNKTALLEKRLQLPGEIPLTYADITKAQDLLGYKPTTDIKQGLKKFTAWFKEFYCYAAV